MAGLSIGEKTFIVPTARIPTFGQAVRFDRAKCSARALLYREFSMKWLQIGAIPAHPLVGDPRRYRRLRTPFSGDTVKCAVQWPLTSECIAQQWKLA
jgi:hypothetical protein